MGGALLPLAALAAAFLLLGGGGKAAASAPAVTARAVPPPVKKPTPNEALEAATKAEKQGGKPKTTATVTKSNSVAQVIPATTLPPGYSRTQATAKAQPTADHVRTRKGKYDRALVLSFQTSAGLRADGLYGPQVVAALRYFGAKNVPAPLFKGSNTKYAPPAGG